MPIDLISVKQATEEYGYSGSHLRDLLGKGVITGEKIAGVWLVDPDSVEEHQARMERLGSKKHGTWAKAAGKQSPAPDTQRVSSTEGEAP
jgi:hypothetical protein